MSETVDQPVSATALPGAVALEQLDREPTTRRHLDTLLEHPSTRGRLLAGRRRRPRGSAASTADLPGSSSERLMHLAQLRGRGRREINLLGGASSANVTVTASSPSSAPVRSSMKMVEVRLDMRTNSRVARGEKLLATGHHVAG